jgi:hypothetical protein
LKEFVLVFFLTFFFSAIDVSHFQFSINNRVRSRSLASDILENSFQQGGSFLVLRSCAGHFRLRSDRFSEKRQIMILACESKKDEGAKEPIAIHKIRAMAEFIDKSIEPCVQFRSSPLSHIKSPCSILKPTNHNV